MMETIANITTVRNLLDEYDLKVKKKYGQNLLFMVSLYPGGIILPFQGINL